MKWRMMLKIDDNFFVRFWPHNVRHQLPKVKTLFKLCLAWKSNKKFQNENLIFSCEMKKDVENWWQFFVRFWPHNVRHQLSKVKTLLKLRLAWKSNKNSKFGYFFWPFHQIKKGVQPAKRMKIQGWIRSSLWWRSFWPPFIFGEKEDKVTNFVSFSSRPL